MYVYYNYGGNYDLGSGIAGYCDSAEIWRTFPGTDLPRNEQILYDDSEEYAKDQYNTQIYIEYTAAKTSYKEIIVLTQQQLAEYIAYGKAEAAKGLDWGL